MLLTIDLFNFTLTILALFVGIIGIVYALRSMARSKTQPEPITSEEAGAGVQALRLIEPKFSVFGGSPWDFYREGHTALKEFEHLNFSPRCKQSPIAIINFDNGYGVRVISGYASFSSSNDLFYEITVLKDGEITYSTDITDDVIAGLSSVEVTEVMAQIQAL
jgi:hypothetical protein